MRLYRSILVVAVTALLMGARASAQDEAESANPNLSRQMQLAIRYYEKGDDMQAMDRFMEILTRGDPAERTMANEYLNLINHRMNTGETAAPAPSSRRPTPVTAEPVAQARPAAAPAAVRAPEVVVESAKDGTAASAKPIPVEPAAAPLPPPAPARRVVEEQAPAPVDKALMRREIKAKLRSGVDAGLKTLRGIEGVRVLMMESGDPQAVAIPSSLLFSQGISFQKDAAAILDALTRLIFGLGSAQTVILPEGAPVGDAKILDMRRTMGISSHLFSAGIAPPRVKVNLLSSQVEIPRPLQDFRGILILFVYNQPLNLVADTAVGEEGGPPISLGIYPAAFSPDKSEGAIVEFSVQDPPAGLVSWKFQLLQPTVGDVRDLAPLQDVVGGSPVFHQIYWNGRENYFGSPLAPGRYECVLTATDARNRQRTLHRWIQVLDSNGGLGAPAPTVSAAPSRDAGAPPAALSSPVGKAVTLVKEKAEPKPAKAAKKGRAKKAAKAAPAEEKTGGEEQPASDAPAADASEGDDAGASASASAPAPAAKSAAKATKPTTETVELAFGKNTHKLTRAAERKLAEVNETLVYYPQESLRVMGYAESSETEASALADRRAQMVASLLINKYQVEPKRINVVSSVVETAAHKVEITFVKNE